MKSNVCKINQGVKDLEAIFHESEKIAVYNGLTHKQSLQLRLLCEEIDGMLPQVIDDFDGEIWIEFDEGVCKVKLSVQIAELTADKKAELIDIAKDKKNAAVVGIAGKVRSAIENFFLNEENRFAFSMSSGMHNMATGYGDTMDYTYLWSLEQYKRVVTKDVQAEEWDELEKSVIAAVADDVIVGVKGKSADIVIVKKFV